MSFENKVVLITGAATGIGRATAVEFARQGARVVIGDIEFAAQQVEETLQEIKAVGGEATFIPTDVSQEDQVKALVDKTVETYGGLDIAFNNAGVLSGGFISDLEEPEFNRLMDVDVKGVWLCMKHEINFMKKHGGGSIINTASEAGLVGPTKVGAYSAAKHAVIGLTKSAAAENANLGIRINAVCPGAIATPMVVDAPQELQDTLLAPQALNRFGTPEEVANLVVFMSSDKVDFMVGSVVTIDGGATANAQSYDPSQNPSS